MMKSESSETPKQEQHEQPSWVQLELPFEDFELGAPYCGTDGTCESCQ